MYQILSHVDNSVVLLWLFIMGVILAVFYNVLQFIMKTNPEVNHQPPIPSQNPHDNVGEHEECPICTERIKYKIELDCRHNFCGKCIMDYYVTTNREDLSCPICRKSIRIINSENITRTTETREFYDRIVRFNHKNLNGINYVKICFILTSILRLFPIFLICFIMEYAKFLSILV